MERIAVFGQTVNALFDIILKMARDETNHCAGFLKAFLPGIFGKKRFVYPGAVLKPYKLPKFFINYTSPPICDAIFGLFYTINFAFYVICHYCPQTLLIYCT